MSSTREWCRLTASMFSDAASLLLVSSRPPSTCRDNIPAIVVVAVDVEHFLALDTKDTASMSAFAQTRFRVRVLP
jgi:hypothetical protein